MEGKNIGLLFFGYLAAKLVELRERFQFDESETSTSAINKVLNAYKIYMHNVTFEEVP